MSKSIYKKYHRRIRGVAMHLGDQDFDQAIQSIDNDFMNELVKVYDEDGRLNKETHDLIWNRSLSHDQDYMVIEERYEDYVEFAIGILNMNKTSK